MPGGVSPFSIVFKARSRRCRAMMMPLSVETRFSLVRSTIGPMLSCKEASCLAIDQVIVGLVGGGDVGPRHIGDVDALSRFHGLALFVGERPRHLVVEAPG